MSKKTDQAENVGKHAFEVAGLGKAPFQFVGFSENAFNNGDGTTKPGGCCDYCANGIRYECHILSADSKRFKVGTNCVERVGDKGIMQAYKRSPEFRKMQRDKRNEKGRLASAAVRQVIEENRDLFATQPHPCGYNDRQTGKPLTLLDQIQWMLENCGTSGITRYRKTVENYVARLKCGLPAIQPPKSSGYGDDSERRADAAMLTRTGYGDPTER